jgi:hypothetical protein
MNNLFWIRKYNGLLLKVNLFLYVLRCEGCCCGKRDCGAELRGSRCFHKAKPRLEDQNRANIKGHENFVKQKVARKYNKKMIWRFFKVVKKINFIWWPFPENQNDLDENSEDDDVDFLLHLADKPSDELFSTSPFLLICLLVIFSNSVCSAISPLYLIYKLMQLARLFNPLAPQAGHACNVEIARGRPLLFNFSKFKKNIFLLLVRVCVCAAQWPLL